MSKRQPSRKARITVADNFQHQLTVTMPWDGTEDGKVDTRRTAMQWAQAICPTLIPGIFVANEKWGIR